MGRPSTGTSGLTTVSAWKDDAAGALIRTAIWDSKSDYEAGRPDLSKSLERVDLEPLDHSAEA